MNALKRVAPFWQGVLGGVAAMALFSGAQAVADSTTGWFRLLNAERLQVLDAQNRRTFDLHRLPNGGSGLFVFDQKGRSRMEVGTYEDGLPFIALESEDHSAKSIYRLAGANHSAVLVFKDKRNRDRMILGLDMNGPDEEPFLVTFDKQGRKKVHFGTY